MRPISKTDYLTYLECPKNAWIKIHKREVYKQFPLSEFEKSIIETGNEVEDYARTLFPAGTLIDGRDAFWQKKTQELIDSASLATNVGPLVIFQPVFVSDGFLAAADILEYDPSTSSGQTGTWNIYEVKASNSVKETGDRNHVDDLAFQRVVLMDAGIQVGRCFILHMDPTYVRRGGLELEKLFVSDDMTEQVTELEQETREKMQRAKEYLGQEYEPAGYCSCIYKGRSKHCTTFPYSNPDIPDYSIHDIARIGASKTKLKELVDREIWQIDDIPEGMEFSKNQQAQIDAYRYGPHKDMLGIRYELEKLTFPLYFLDYETYPSAIPRFTGFSPYQQIPFQFSLHVLRTPDEVPEHYEYLHEESDDPTDALATALSQWIGTEGSIIVWNKKFEIGRNVEIAARNADFAPLMANINNRIYDLMDVFTKQHYVERDFMGSTSIKYVLPVLAPELTYKDLAIREGGTASEKWNQMTGGTLPQNEREEIAYNLKVYCKLDTYAMYAIWKKLYETVYK
ncbi:MAG: DUF2779 domain-containing protein [Candidatus Pacebacteria bacterium]|jgi:hypothetical protein|nr:DUF2779 domain-containing protein [Candidatus Paceibacterota bacterium]